MSSENNHLKKSKKDLNNKLMQSKNINNHYANELDEAYDNIDSLKINKQNLAPISSPTFLKILSNLEDNEFDVTNNQILENFISPNGNILDLSSSEVLSNLISPNGNILDLSSSEVLSNSPISIKDIITPCLEANDFKSPQM
ncbi:hypothetical protein [Spiroplasma endosymbiont of Melieria omissa]|uniref:hypothetical protein n=1 Tax=Spiroplasma endosymbiont of Melieria omissa TaxID=3139324 RepID=UPI003CCAC5AF